MKARINELEFSTKIGINIITVYFMSTLGPENIPKFDEIDKIIQKEFNHGLNLYENAALILYGFKTNCLTVEISPQLRGSKQSYKVRVRR